LLKALVTMARAQDDPKPPGTTVQETEPAADSPVIPDGPKTYPPFRRVPSYFGQVGLSIQQRSDIYVLRGRYQAEITALKQRIEDLSRQEMAECEAILTEAQRKLLVQLRDVKRPQSTSSGN
jgi:hypothetical protein